MPEVTALRVQKRRKDRVNVYLDGCYAFSLQDVVAAGLHVGQTLAEGEIEELRRRDNSESAYDKALSYLSYRNRSALEVRRYLRDKEVPEDAIAGVMARLERNRLIDDLAFARYWVENRRTFRPRGAWALRAELRQKGVRDEVISTALEDQDEETDALEAARRVLRRLVGLEELAFRQRLLSHLRRRGFGYDVARRVVDRLWQEVGNRPEGEAAGQTFADDE
ncbi:MAG: RecX family transcriptional regulator [Chloroflexi bacterium]|nr:RecX family transcriptional regulator [Chloroflexota bacterium]